MNGFTNLELDCSEFVEVDPTGRYGRYYEVLGKGASKTVYEIQNHLLFDSYPISQIISRTYSYQADANYRAFDEYEGIEVAWNQVKLFDFLQSPEDLERLYCEIHLLKTLKHGNIMKFYTSWVDTSKRNINFVTEMFTSGTLRQYRLRHRRVNIRAVKHWCRQILNGLLYLHSHDPPVIHRDLKCDNIFINGNQGEVKIGDLGLAAILRKSHAAHCVGTPEFMAPEVYEEQYNELVDIYSFGMCILEMVTFEYPYSECTHPAQIYKKVISGKRPDALYKVKDSEVRGFIDKCLATVSCRLSARELLNDPFLQMDDCDLGFGSNDFQREFYDAGPLMRVPILDHHSSISSLHNGYCNSDEFEHYDEWGSYPQEIEATGIDLFGHHDDDEHSPDVDITIKGKMREDRSIFLRLRISDKEGRIRNIYFPFDIELDTALSVATEMVAELDITDQDVTHIADMIDGEIIKLVPEWKPGPGIEETPRFANLNFCQNCVSSHTSIGSFKDYLSNNHAGHSAPFFQSCNGCGSMHGRFEEITYQADGSQYHTPEINGPLQGFTESNGVPDHHQHQLCHESWDPQKSVYLNSSGCSGASSSGEELENVGKVVAAKTENDGEYQNQFVDKLYSTKHLSKRGSYSLLHSSSHCALLDDFENDLQRELRWLRAKCLLELRDKQLKSSSCVHPSHDKEDREDGLLKSESDASSSYLCCSTQDSSCPCSATQGDRNCVATINNNPRISLETKTSNKSSNTSSALLPHSLQRTTSLPVDAVHIQ